MDFHSLLSTAQQNLSTSKNKDKYYSTSYAPPKKETKEKKLSNNIKKFLEKQKEEEEEKQRIAREKKLELLARRDPKIQKKVEKSLKVFKSSKKFYTGDKTLDENTALTLQNEQPDEDDYGFASSTSDIFHQKLMEKYQKLPTESKFAKSLNQKKGKANAQDDSEDHHFKNGHRDRVSKLKGETSSKSNGSSSKSSQSSHVDKKAPEEKPKPKLKAAPIVDFHELLKLAEKKQHEEIMIDVPTKKEPERLMTSKEKKEQEELEAWRKSKLKPQSSAIPKIAKLGAIPKVGESIKHDKNNNNSKGEEVRRTNGLDKKVTSIKPTSSSSTVDRQKLKPTSNSPQSNSSKLRDALTNSEKSSKVPSTSKASSSSLKSRDPPPKPGTSRPSQPLKSDRPSTSKEVSKTREFPPKDLQKTREFPPRDLQKTRDFPPRDLQRSREFPPRDLKRPMYDKKPRHPVPNKRRMYDDDDDSEYDSEMDDFIDDGDVDIDVSSEIKNIFGYDKNRYRDEDFDDREMISDYRTVMKEEYISKKIGLMEDLEDMKREAEELKRKEMRKKMMAKKHKHS